MRAVLIVNPAATSTTPAGRDLLAHALKSRLDLTVEHTRHHGHGVELGQAAAENEVDLVVVHGGDGTVSGVVNGLLGRPDAAGAAPTRRVPAVAVVPGGSANALARALGIARDPIAATNQLIGLIDDHRHNPTWRRIGLIDCGERWAVFNAGMGVDAEVVAAVEAQRDRGGTVTPWRYVRAAIPAVWGYIRREPTLTLQLPGRTAIDKVSFAFVSNTSPWTFANNRPVWTNPGCTFDSGLGVFAPTTLKAIPTLRIVRQMFAKRPKFEFAHLITDDDVACLHVTSAAAPIASQLDGDYLGTRETMTFRAVANALAVVAPPANRG